MNVTLVAFKSDGERRDFRVKGDRCVIGRKSGCELQIPVSTVSRQHCEIVIENGAVKLRDLGSSNGTFLNNTRVREAALKAGDHLQIGPALFTVQIDGKPATIEPIFAHDAAPHDLNEASASAGPGASGSHVDENAESAVAAPSVKPAPKQDSDASDDDDDDPLARMIAQAEGDDSSVFEFDFLDEEEEEE